MKGTQRVPVLTLLTLVHRLMYKLVMMVIDGIRPTGDYQHIFHAVCQVPLKQHRVLKFSGFQIYVREIVKMVIDDTRPTGDYQHIFHVLCQV